MSKYTNSSSPKSARSGLVTLCVKHTANAHETEQAIKCALLAMKAELEAAGVVVTEVHGENLKNAWDV